MRKANRDQAWRDVCVAVKVAGLKTSLTNGGDFIVDIGGGYAWLSYIGPGLLTLSSFIEGERLFGAVLGGWLVIRTRHRLKIWQHTGSFMLSAGVGYLFAPGVVRFATFLSSGASAFICALVVIPISIKIMVWVGKTDLVEIIRRLKGGR